MNLRMLRGIFTMGGVLYLTIGVMTTGCATSEDLAGVRKEVQDIHAK